MSQGIEQVKDLHLFWVSVNTFTAVAYIIIAIANRQNGLAEA
jgi:hypothetical protein